MALRSLIFVLSYLTILILSKCNSRVVIHSICYCTQAIIPQCNDYFWYAFISLIMCQCHKYVSSHLYASGIWITASSTGRVALSVCSMNRYVCVCVCSFLNWTNPCRRAIGQSELCHRLFYDHSDIRTYIQTHHETHPGKCVNRPSCTEIDSGVPSLLSNLRIKSINLLKMCSPFNYNILEWLIVFKVFLISNNTKI